MADLKNSTPDEPSLPPAKRSTDLDCLDQDNVCKKKQKSEISAGKTPFQERDDDDECNKENESSDDDDDDDDDDDEEDGVVDEEEEQEEEEVPLNGKSVVDKKGKGIMTEDKGKGKLKVEEGSNDDDDDDSVDDGIEHSDDDDSDLSNDPLAEVDLDNILPSRTRRRVNHQPGAYLVNDIDEDDDSDDSDASV